ncbi:MAG: DUF3375 family protein, partial [Spirochaetota bacterium]
RSVLKLNIRHDLQARSQISLGEVIGLHPLQQGLAELVTYLAIVSENSHTVFYDSQREIVQWNDGDAMKQASIPRIILNGI